MTADDDRYESIELIVKARLDGESWFDIISELISSDCEGTDDIPCSCGLESMGGSQGTLEQCYDHLRISETWTTVKTQDVKKILNAVSKNIRTVHLTEDELYAIQRVRKEAYWHDEFDEWLEQKRQEPGYWDDDED